MKRTIALVLALAAGTAAVASDDNGSVDAATIDAIKTQLSLEGYEVLEIEAEDGMFEAEAVKDGVEYEIYLDDQFNITVPISNRSGVDNNRSLLTA